MSDINPYTVDNKSYIIYSKSTLPKKEPFECGTEDFQITPEKNSFDKLKSLSAKETATLQTELEQKTKELQRKEDALLRLDQELKAKQALLEEREKRVNELEEAIRKKEDFSSYEYHSLKSQCFHVLFSYI